MKVVLCFLPERFGRGKIFSLPPLGILNIATYLKSTNIDVSVIDAFVKGWDLSKIVNYISRLKPDILGISTLTPQVYSAIKLVHEIKKHTDAKVCVGGPHVTATKGELFNYCDIDFIIRGEGESSFYKLCHALQTEDYSNIKGLLYKKNGEIVENAGFEMINDINSLPFPDLSLLDWRDYSILDGVSKYATSIMSSRGCPYSCLFCEVALVQGKKLRLRQPENICEEIEYDHNMFGIREFVFKDSTFTVKKDWVYELLDLIMRKQLKIKWTCNARVDCVDLPLLKAMKKSGCRKISYGIESGDQTVLNNINKNITIEQVLSTFDLMKKARIDSHAFFMIGNPGENKGTVRKTIELAKKINPTTAAFGVTIVYPGTPLYSWAIKNNKLTDNKWYMDYHSKIFFASPETVSKGQLLLENLSPEDQLIAAKMANKQFYFKLTWILNLLLQRKLWFIIRLIKVSPKILCNILRGSKGTN